MAVKKEISEALHRITHGVYVISTKHGKKVNAMTAAWVARASFVPPLVTVAIGKMRYSHDLIQDGGVFAINILGRDAISTGKHFGLTTGSKVDKFSDVSYDIKATGSPILKDAIAWLDCKVVSHHDAGDHTLFIGEVLDGGVLKDEEPIVYKREGFFK
ncbi:MAG: flavin reductase [Deltaproteobacteria bacterium]|nr:flavin reductase [Deltaproteobacteria bacterium]MBI3754980.1 flavin reductase [Deltaproteobacteria bacterium]